jgi:hypothetical protein
MFGFYPKFVAAAVVAVLALGLFGTTVSANPPVRVVVWADGTLYNSVVPLSPHGTVSFGNIPDGNVPSVADLETTDDFYIVASNTMTPFVSDAAPGDRDYNGGRWLPHTVTPVGAGPGIELTSEEAIVAAALAGKVTISAPGPNFLCPLTSRV